MKFIIEGEKQPEAEPEVRLALRLDEDGDPVLTVNGVEVLYFGDDGSVWRWRLFSPQREILTKLGFKFTPNETLHIE